MARGLGAWMISLPDFRGADRKNRPVFAKWEPLTLPELQLLFADFGGPLWIAGGLAIELAVGTSFREHRDIDVLILRRDQQRIRGVMKGWDVCAAEPSGALRPWRDDETFDAPINSLWCRRRANSPWALEILLDEARGDDWVSRRSPAVSRPITSLGWLTPDSFPVLAPEVQLFYKAQEPRLEDECDFSAVLPHLTAPQRVWLDDALEVPFPEHPWRERLRLLDRGSQ